MPNRDYILAADPFTPGDGRTRRHIKERVDDGPWHSLTAVGNEDAMDVLDLLRRAYRDGREDRSAEVINPRTLRVYLATQRAIQQELGDGHDEMGHNITSREHWAKAEVLRDLLKYLGHELEMR